MLLSAFMMRVLLIVCLLGLMLLAISFLGQRKVPWLHYLSWGLIAILLPLVGPFWVITRRSRKRFRRPRRYPPAA